ncbi:hypothetical protein LCGC14_0654980 [marine sediment metagenome]|uniref:Uncharacterized protein n=1 Tax=marine sediment metagenome TaxID=412755 RepID=A0A0F9TGZ9_9ZZZZ
MTGFKKYAKNETMRIEILAVLIQEGSKLCSEFLRIRSRRPKQLKDFQPVPAPPAEPQEINEETDAGKIEEGTACLPCTNSHLHACVGLLSEAVRMSPDGLNPESMKRVDKCLGEIAAAERVDLAPENVDNLPVDEKKIASHASKEMREIRHGLEDLNSREELEQLTIRTTSLQKYVGSEWFKMRLAKMPKAEKVRLAEETIEKLETEV